MKKSSRPSSPAAYVSSLNGWQRTCVEGLRRGVRASGELEETVKWGHLVYFSNGPVLLIRAEERRVLLGFWRGQRLGAVDERLKPGGKYEMATIELRQGTSISPTIVRRLTKEAMGLNAVHGDPTQAAKRARNAA